MVKVSGANRLQLAAAAAAMITAGLVTAPAAAAAPACDGYKLPSFMGITESITDSVNISVTIGWSPDGKSGRANMNGYGAEGSYGNVSGGLSGRHAEFRVDWDQGPHHGTYSRFAGDVRDDLSLDGVVENAFLPGTYPWHMEGQVECVAPKPDTNPAAGQKTATVVQAADIYDKPDGKGQKIGTLFPGEVHPLMEPCRDDWCRVGQIELGGFPGLPNGTAWVYAKGFLTFSN